MHIILGASGQVGSAIVANLTSRGESVRAVVRSEQKGEKLKEMGAEVAVADARDLDALKKAFQGGTTLFVLTPETGQEEDVLGETDTILQNYRNARESAGIGRIVGLSSIGAHRDHGTGNLLMSYKLEHAFDGVRVKKTFIRPAYYFSNWAMYLPVVKESGVLPSFYPVDFAIPMIAPIDVAACITDALTDGSDAVETKIVEVAGPAEYTPADVARAFANALGKDVKAAQLPRDEWGQNLEKAGFTPDAVDKFVEMTDAVLAGQTKAEGINTVRTEVTLQEYVDGAISG